MLSHSEVQSDNLFQKALLYAIELPRNMKSTVLLIIDFIVSIIAFYLAVALRYGNTPYELELPIILFYAGLPIALLGVSNFYLNVIRIFQDESMRRVLLILLAYLFIGHFLIQLNIVSSVPRAAPAIHAFLLFVWIWNSRISLHFLIPKVLRSNRDKRDKQSVLVYGIGNMAKDLIHVLHQTSQYQIIGVIDNRSELVGGRILGVKVYSDENLPQLIEQLEAEHIFFALPPESRHLQNDVIKRLADVPVKISQIPSLDDITSGKLKISDVKPVDVLDVLQRDMVEPDVALLGKNIKNKVVLVTGAGGSIGSELCRQIIKQQPATLILFELSEFALYAIHAELQQSLHKHPLENPVQLIAHLGNVTNQSWLETLCQRYQVDTIYHAAAYKHVPIVEFNEYEGVMNNFVGTYRTLQAGINTGVKNFVAISTDKAVRPTNVMGATKRMAELACQALADSQSTMTISMVRFGNVLGSSGSVVPLFNKQIANGGPVTVTHPDVTRYFMTIPEAAQLVIQAGAMATGGEVFVLDMGEPVKIVDLARRMIRLSGRKVKDNEHPNGDIEIVFAGLRPGEKLYEELIIGGDNIELTKHPLIMQAREHQFDKAQIDDFMGQVLTQYATSQDTTWLKNQFEYFVEGYKDRLKSENNVS